MAEPGEISHVEPLSRQNHRRQRYRRQFFRQLRPIKLKGRTNPMRDEMTQTAMTT
jgi:hypothetical protein